MVLLGRVLLDIGEGDWGTDVGAIVVEAVVDGTVG